MKKLNKYSLLHLSNTRFAKSNLRLLSYNAKLKDEIKKLKLIDKDTISIQWSTLDVKQQLKDRNKKEKLNIKECREVLSRCLRRHDATMGLSWDIMDIHIDDVIEERDKKND